MKILFLADEESKMYWEYFKKEDFKGIDIIVSCGDLNPSYLSFLTTMVGVPLLYVHGNHDDKYNVKPPEGCICIEDEIYEYEGVRFLGLGGSNRYKPGENQYTQKEMTKRVKKLWWKLKRKTALMCLLPIRRQRDCMMVRIHVIQALMCLTGLLSSISQGILCMDMFI